MINRVLPKLIAACIGVHFKGFSVTQYVFKEIVPVTFHTFGTADWTTLYRSEMLKELVVFVTLLASCANALTQVQLLPSQRCL